MLRKCYKYLGWWGTSTGEVLQQARVRVQARARPSAGTQARSYIIYARDKLEKLEAGKELQYVGYRSWDHGWRILKYGIRAYGFGADCYGYWFPLFCGRVRRRKANRE